jgi:hypothetical protein
MSDIQVLTIALSIVLPVSAVIFGEARNVLRADLLNEIAKLDERITRLERQP